eukprot:TRINITY_DN3863_c0_g1_i1.p1 TRINITY_DN3863_c0_g1~~TRINITY_DN3863_c0_g1_i1.p1  ORF type:complete len:402 (+),score=44.71 TRINITY_DN3863_c0_g1_i1:59-1207(+)
MAALRLWACGATFHIASAAALSCSEGELELGDTMLLLQTSPVRALGKDIVDEHAYAPGTCHPVCSNSSNDWRFLNPKSLVSIPPLIQAKVHKTAGSTLSRIILRLTDRRNLRTMDVVPQKPPNRYLGWPGPFPGDRPEDPPSHQYDTVALHSVCAPNLMRAYVRTSPTPFFIATLREPGAQALSAYNYLVVKSKHTTLSGDSWESHMRMVRQMPLSGPPCVPETDLETMSCKGWFINPQAHDLGWYQWVGANRDSDNNSTRVNEFLLMLDENFASDGGMVILTEYFDMGLLLLRRRLGLDLRELAYIRSRSEPYAITVSEQMRQEARDANGVDVALYAHYNRTFHRSWASEYAANGEELEAELEDLQRLNAELEALGRSVWP